MNSKQKKYQDPTRKDWISGIALLLIYLIVISFSAFLLIPEHWIWWLFLFLVSTFLLVFNQNTNYACRCRKCKEEFEVSFLVNLISPHGIDKNGSWQLVKCPNCDKRSKASVIKVVKSK
jgi:Flp pilus assembly protein TadB